MEEFDLIPCLNDNSDHINLLEKLIKDFLNEFIFIIQVFTLNRRNILMAGLHIC